VLSCVRKAEERLLEKQLDKEYAPITGVPAFDKGAIKLAYGPDSSAVKDGRIAVTQSISGTGALRIGGEFLARFYDNKNIYVPTPTWYPLLTNSIALMFAGQITLVCSKILVSLSSIIDTMTKNQSVWIWKE
jgi:aspartate/tyrosine/aromatic aminotransferase